ncbi:MAG: histidinol-phosphate transaminase [Candidatus Omnitrophota bacterium]
MSGLVRSGVANIEPYEPGKPIEEVQRQLGLREVYKLASNENPLGPSPKAVAALKRALKNINRYPDGNCYYLKVKLAKKLKVKPENLIFGNGSDELISIAVLTFLDEDEETIVAEPTFLEYRLIVEAFGRRVRTIPCLNLRYDLDGMKKAITDNTKIIFIANPDNPTGTYVTDKQLDKFLDGLPNNVLVVIDEAYNEFVDVKDFPNAMKYLYDKNILIFRTFAKAYGLAGLRLGYCVGRAEFIDCMNRVRQPFNVNALAQVAALAALDDAEHLKKTRATILKGKKYLYKNLDKIGLSYVPSAANFILVDVKRDGRKLFEQMLRYGVIVRDMKQYKLDNYIRVTIGTELENRKFIETLKKVITLKEE